MIVSVLVLEKPVDRRGKSLFSVLQQQPAPCTVAQSLPGLDLA